VRFHGFKQSMATSKPTLVRKRRGTESSLTGAVLDRCGGVHYKNALRAFALEYIGSAASAHVASCGPYGSLAQLPRMLRSPV
jgi:hypothetical protein